jgi:hypothetical protein
VSAACTADGAASQDTTPDFLPIVPEQTAPADRLTPFCQAMNDINDRLESDPPADIEGFVLERYRSLLDEVPDIIAVDFAAVLADLEGNPMVPPSTGPIPTPDEVTTPGSTTPGSTTPTTAEVTTPGSTAPGSTAPHSTTPGPTTPGPTVAPPEGDELSDEGYAPGDTPAERVNSYVAFVCRDTANNPGPPATEPLLAPTTTSP